jgi:chaperonin GroES
MSETYQLLGNRLLVRMNEETQTKVGAIIMPECSKKPQDRATIIAVGTGKEDKEGKLIPPAFFPGQVVIIERAYGNKIRVNNEELLVIKADEIIAIVG